MKFVKYPSLVRTEDAAKGKLQKIIAGLADEEFYATEKIHGCNFAIYCDPNGFDFKFAKRTAFVGIDEDFFGWQDAKLIPMNAFIEIAVNYPEFKSIIVFGELFGGEIQENVTYEQTVSGNKEFKVFNVFGELEDGSYFILGYENIKKFFADEFLAPYSAKGSFWTLLKGLDLEKDSEFGGISEGFVVQPYGDRIWKEGDTFIGFKHKTQHFTEVSPAKMNDLIGRAATIEDLRRYVTFARLVNILSHGDLKLDVKNIGPGIDAMLADIRKEYPEEISDRDWVGYSNQLKPATARLIYEFINAKEEIAA